MFWGFHKCKNATLFRKSNILKRCISSKMAYSSCLSHGLNIKNKDFLQRSLFKYWPLGQIGLSSNSNAAAILSPWVTAKKCFKNWSQASTTTTTSDFQEPASANGTCLRRRQERNKSDPDLAPTSRPTPKAPFAELDSLTAPSPVGVADSFWKRHCDSKRP